MKKILLITVTALLAACSGGGKGGNTIHVKASDSEVGGDLGGYLEVVDGVYDVTKSTKWGKSYEIRVKVKVAEGGTQILSEELEEGKRISSLSLELADSSGSPASGFGEFKCDGFTSFDEIKTLTALLKKGSGEVVLTFYMEQPYKSEGEPDGTGVTAFAINSVLADKSEASETETATSGDNQKETSSEVETNDNQQAKGGDWDKVIDEYEKYADEYAALVEKNPKDMNIMGSKPYQKVLSLGTKLATAQASMSADQAARFTEAQAELMKKIQEYQK
jgi:hypothetical protein